MRPMLVWHWRDAPEEYRALSGHGGDEDFLAIVPAECSTPLWMEYGSFGSCDISEHPLSNGDRVYIGAHA